MKKIFLSLVVLILIIANTVNVYAARFESLGVNIDLPKDYYNLKAGIDTNDSKIEFYTAMMKTTKEQLSAEYKQNSTLYNGISSNLAKEIFISETENNLTKSVFHLSLATDEELAKVEDELKNIAKAQGMEVSTQEIYKLGGVTFVHSIIKNTTITVFQYYTIVNGIGITISLNSTDATAKNDELKNMVDSISFDELQEKPVGITNYILIGVTATLVIMVIVLMFMAFSGKKDDEADYQDDDIKE